MTMKFYMTRGSCSTGIHILLEEAGLVFEAHLVNLLTGDQQSESYRAINPKGTIPALVRYDGTALTDFMSIAWWLAHAYPRRKLLPEGLENELQVLEWMSYAVNTIHGQGFTRIFTTERYTANEAEHDAVKAQGLAIVKEGFALVERQLEGKEYLIGSFSIADAALFYMLFWADRIDIPLLPNCQRHYTQMLARSAVRQVLMEEGYSTVYREREMNHATA